MNAECKIQNAELMGNFCELPIKREQKKIIFLILLTSLIFTDRIEVEGG